MSGAEFFNSFAFLMDCIKECDIESVNGEIVRIKPREGYYHYLFGESEEMVRGICTLLVQLRDAWENKDKETEGGL